MYMYLSIFMSERRKQQYILEQRVQVAVITFREPCVAVCG